MKFEVSLKLTFPFTTSIVAIIYTYTVRRFVRPIFTFMLSTRLALSVLTFLLTQHFVK